MTIRMIFHVHSLMIPSPHSSIRHDSIDYWPSTGIADKSGKCLFVCCMRSRKKKTRSDRGRDPHETRRKDSGTCFCFVLTAEETSMGWGCAINNSKHVWFFNTHHFFWAASSGKMPLKNITLQCSGVIKGRVQANGENDQCSWLVKGCRHFLSLFRPDIATYLQNQSELGFELKSQSYCWMVVT